jgi:hypothetical protein
VQKYSEAALCARSAHNSKRRADEGCRSGCLVVGNLPADRRDAFADFVVPISMSNTDEEIMATIQRWLADDDARIKRAKRGQAYFAARFSQEKYVEDVIRWVGLIRDGQRGLVLPHQWDFIGARRSVLRLDLAHWSRRC